jgi:hypothetical protein
MADYLDHIRQAEHNTSLAQIILDEHPGYYDWLITVSFYAAIHFVEAGFAQDPQIGHSETCKPPGKEMHQHREDLVRVKYGNECWKHYKKLRTASHTARYLVTMRPGLATDYYSLNDAKSFFNTDLSEIRRLTSI